jgi:AGZA family xanthine/uracil permease-like MFS transporter
MFEKWFKLKEHGVTVKGELAAGLTTFMTMAYILAVNPSILGVTGMSMGGVLIATAISSAIACICMAFFANLPFALAPGMGLNAYFAFTVVFKMGYSWQFALFAVFVEGVIFILLSLTNVREAIFSTEKGTVFAHVSAKSTGTRSLGIPACALRIKSTSPPGTDSSDTQTSH